MLIEHTSRHSFRNSLNLLRHFLEYLPHAKFPMHQGHFGSPKGNRFLGKIIGLWGKTWHVQPFGQFPSHFETGTTFKSPSSQERGLRVAQDAKFLGLARWWQIPGFETPWKWLSELQMVPQTRRCHRTSRICNEGLSCCWPSWVPKAWHLREFPMFIFWV